MFQNDDLKEHLETSSVIRNRSLVIAEWNLNQIDNIFSIGNYRYRPSEEIFLTTGKSIYSTLNNFFDVNDEGYYYTNATNADAVIDGGIADDGTPTAFKSVKQKEQLLFSLEDCFGKFRPRSGINKLRYFGNNFIHHTNRDMDKRPRYYMADKNDKFKYWSSYRTEALYKYVYDDTSIKYGASPTFIDGVNTKNGILVSSEQTRGLSFSKSSITDRYYIDDAAPFVVYENTVPANRIVVKMQTNIGSVNLGPFTNSNGNFADPFYSQANATTPLVWKIQYLENDNWVDAISFNENSTRNDGSAIVPSDGYVELSYGLTVPEQYRSTFFKAGEVYSQYALPEIAIDGEAYLVKSSATDLGVYHIWSGGAYQTFTPIYGWYLTDSPLQNSDAFATELVQPSVYVDSFTNQDKYREFQYIRGIRIVVEAMNKTNCAFDLIEMSPRLVADLSDKTTGFSITKPASDLGLSGMPVGQLLAGTGDLTLFDYDLAFSVNNENSIIAPYIMQKTQIKFYEIIKDDAGVEHYVPLKTLYSEDFPETDITNRESSLALRDLFFLFESTTAPELLIPNAPLSYAISTLLDNVGFSNYVFKKLPEESEPIIPFFFVGPDTSVAEVLEQLAVSTQTAMFFDEENNFVAMTKNYIMPTVDERATDIVLYGSKDFQVNGAYKNQATSTTLANIQSISTQENKVYNDGKINFTTRYIQKSYGKIRQANFTGRDKNWIYKPALLWEVTGDQNLYPQNEEVNNSSNYVLTAIPLNADLSALVPSVVNHQLVNNVVDFGEAIDFMSRYNGYFYANGEIIKFDAIEFSVSGQIDNVWMTSTQDFQRYFSQLPFNGKIYPTGLVRIYAEPNYEVIDGITRMKNGEVAKHGRGQFGTPIIAHSAGLSNYWSSNDNVKGCTMDTRYLFDDKRFNPTNTVIYQLSEFTNNEDYTTFTINSTSDLAVGDIVRIIPINLTSPVPAIYSFSAPIIEIVNAENKFTVLYPLNAIEYCIDNIIVYEMQIDLQTPQDSFDYGAAGTAGNGFAQRSTRNGVIKNFLSSSNITENEANQLYTTQSGTIQSSALVFSGGKYPDSERPIQKVSYIYKALDNGYKHFGTRMRIIGRVTNDDKKTQEVSGSMQYYSVPTSRPDESPIINGGSGGIAIGLNKDTNVGYYFEIISIDGLSTIAEGIDNDRYVNVHNIVFYKIIRNTDPETGEPNAVPIKLWGGLSNILVDSGDFTGQYRFVGEKNPTVYDLAVEYENIGTTRKFYLYINNRLIQVVDDSDPLPEYNNMALFIRGSSKCMFENIYAISGNYSINQEEYLKAPVKNIFGTDKIKVSDALQKYAMSAMVQGTYLNGIHTNSSPEYNLYFEEFGTIMREAAYFKVRYDKAYPALYAKISPTFTKIRGFTVSGFIPGAYGAEFLIFNNTDTLLNLDETTGNYLRIQGITFTQQSTNELTVDEYFSKLSDFSNPIIQNSEIAVSPIKAKQDYFDIKTSRLTYGKREFNLDAPYIQSYDDANNLMGWMIGKIMKPRLAVGLSLFSNPMIQLGDIVEIRYTDTSNNTIIPEDSRFVVYNIEYNRAEEGPSMTLYLSEVK
jgi:hypothetical protein